MRCLIVGAGLLGLTTAWFLRRHGADVVVCDRRPGPGLETSFANGGMLHASQANPWNEPGVLWQVLKTFGQEDSALLIRPGALLGMLPWALRFFRNATPTRFLDAAARNTRLADYSLSVLNDDLGAADLAFERADLGTLKIYRTDEELARASAAATQCDNWGVRYAVVDVAAVIALEPALAPVAAQLAGGIHFPDDVSGDAHQFCRALATRCADAGVTFHYETNVASIARRQGGFVIGGTALEGEQFATCVIAAGSYSTPLARGIGVRVPVEPVKGYSITVPLNNWPVIPRMPVIDEHFHAAVCPLGNFLRVAGTAEFAAYDDTLRESRIKNLFTLVSQVYPQGAALIDAASVSRWSGFRPMTPDGVGIVGGTGVDGLYLNTGHGHLGWTMAPGAGKLLADTIMTGQAALRLEDYALSRF